jgi:hypothetical protein
MSRIKGGCLCGRVRFSADAEPAFVGVCHCTDCQKFSGSALSTVMAIPEGSLKVDGKLKVFTKAGDSGKPIHRSFCPECGSGVVDKADALPGMVMLYVGTFDDSSWVKPGSQIYCDSAQSWVQLGGDMPRFAKMPGPATAA